MIRCTISLGHWGEEPDTELNAAGLHRDSVYHGGPRQNKRNSLIPFSVAERKPTLAIAGRSLKKLQDVLEWAEASPADVPIILADVHDPASLQKMCQRTKLVLNCVGPFR